MIVFRKQALNCVYRIGPYGQTYVYNCLSRNYMYYFRSPIKSSLYHAIFLENLFYVIPRQDLIEVIFETEQTLINK